MTAPGDAAVDVTTDDPGTDDPLQPHDRESEVMRGTGPSIGRPGCGVGGEHRWEKGMTSEFHATTRPAR